MLLCLSRTAGQTGGRAGAFSYNCLFRVLPQSKFIAMTLICAGMHHYNVSEVKVLIQYCQATLDEFSEKSHGGFEVVNYENLWCCAEIFGDSRKLNPGTACPIRV